MKEKKLSMKPFDPRRPKPVNPSVQGMEERQGLFASMLNFPKQVILLL